MVLPISIVFVIVVIGSFSLSHIRTVELLSENLAHYKQNITKIDNDIDNTKTILSDISKNYMIQSDFDTLSMYEKSSISMSFFSQFMFDDYISSVVIYFYESKKILSTINGIIDAEMFDDYQWFFEKANETRAVSKSLSQSFRMLTNGIKSEKVLTLSATYPQVKTPKIGVVAMNISCAALFNPVMHQDSGIIVLDKNNNPLFENEARPIEKNDPIYMALISSEEEQLFEIKDKFTALYKVVSPKTGWSFLIYDYSKSLKDEIENINLSVFLAAMLIFVFFSALWLIFANKIYNYFSSIRAEVHSVKALFISLINGDTTVETDIITELQRASFPIFERAFTVISAKIEYNDDKNILSYAKLNKRWKLSENYLLGLNDKNISGMYFSEDNINILGLISYDCDLNTLINAVTFARNKLCHELGINVTIGMGNSCNSIADISLSYNEAREALDYELFNGNKTLMHASTLPVLVSESQYVYPDDSEKRIIAAIKAQNKEAAFLVIDDICENTPDSYLIVRYVIDRLWKTMSYIYTHMDTFGTSYEFVYSTPYFDKYREIIIKYSLAEISEYFKNDIELLLEALYEKTILKDEENIDKINRYIEEHYSEDLTLNSIAGVAFLTPAYISTFYKKVTGKNISSYIMTVRMEKAKELLSETTESVNKIAEKVGYISTRSFLRAFKKYTDLTPSEFRGEND